MFYVRQPSKLYPENPGPCKMGVSPAVGPEQVHFPGCVCETEGERAEGLAQGCRLVCSLCLSKAAAATVWPWLGCLSCYCSRAIWPLIE